MISNRCSVAGSMISVMNAEQVEAIVAEELQAPAKFREFVDVGEKIIDPIAQLVTHWREPPMTDGAFVEA
jgi:hypothetical protein